MRRRIPEAFEFICDACGKVVTLDRDVNVPEGWFRLEWYPAAWEQRDYCSARCLSAGANIIQQEAPA